MGDKKEKLQQAEFACESLMEIIPVDTCIGCPFHNIERDQCTLNESEYRYLRDYCVRSIIDSLLKEIKKRC